MCISDILIYFFNKFNNFRKNRETQEPNFSCENIFPVPIFYRRIPIPENIIYYISMNPNSAKVYQKLIQKCKYFFRKNPIIVLNRYNTIQSDHFCKVYDYKNFFRNNKYEFILDIKNINSKLWIEHRLNISSSKPEKNELSLFISKIYQCDIFTLKVYHQKNILIEEFEILTKSKKIKNFDFVDSTIKNSNNDEVIPIEIIFEYLPNLEKGYFCDINQSTTSKTAEKLAQLPQMRKLDELEINKLPEIFDVKIFFDNLKYTSDKNFKFDYADSVSNSQ